MSDDFRTLTGAERDWQVGQLTPPDKYKARLLLRFWSKVDLSPGLGPKGECWEWTGSLSRGKGQVVDGNDYGQIGVSPNHAEALGLPSAHGVTRAHVLAWIVVYGRQIPSGHEVCHFCNNKRCIRDIHLFTGTHLTNMRHARATGIMPTAKPVPTRYGERYASGFTDIQRAILRQHRRDRRIGFSWLCKALEIDMSHLSRLETGQAGGRGLRVDKLICLLKILGIDPVDFDLASLPLTWAVTVQSKPKRRDLRFASIGKKRGPKGPWKYKKADDDIEETWCSLSDLAATAQRLLAPTLSR